ncbi:hypothetical protein WDU94_014300, partial [Cyamophila willieti]
MWSLLVLRVLACALAVPGVLGYFEESKELGKKAEKAILGDEFVIHVNKIRSHRLNRTAHPTNESDTILQIEFPGEVSKDSFILKYKRDEKRILIEFTQNGKTIIEGWRIDKELWDQRDKKGYIAIDSLVLGVSQDITGAKYTLNLDCINHGTVVMTKSLKQIFNNMKKPQLKVSAEFHYFHEINPNKKLSDKLKDEDCFDEDDWTRAKRQSPDLRLRDRDNEVDPRYRSRPEVDLIPSGRSKYTN